MHKNKPTLQPNVPETTPAFKVLKAASTHRRFTGALHSTRPEHFKRPVNNSKVENLLSEDTCALARCKHNATRISLMRAVIRKLQGIEQLFHGHFSRCWFLAWLPCPCALQGGLAYPVVMATLILASRHEVSTSSPVSALVQSSAL